MARHVTVAAEEEGEEAAAARSSAGCWLCGCGLPVSRGTANSGLLVCIVFEGWDASGKGGAIKRLVRKLDPRHVRVRAFSAPTKDQLRHHWLWRFWPVLPGWGGMAVFDRPGTAGRRSNASRGTPTTTSGSGPYTEIREFESMLVVEGTILVKFWMHIPDEEKLRRSRPARKTRSSCGSSRRRLAEPKKREAYAEAVEDMLAQTSTTQAPWHLIEGDSKRFARLRVVETINQAIEAAIGGGQGAKGS